MFEKFWGHARPVKWVMNFKVSISCIMTHFFSPFKHRFGLSLQFSWVWSFNFFLFHFEDVKTFHAFVRDFDAPAVCMWLNPPSSFHSSSLRESLQIIPLFIQIHLLTFAFHLLLLGCWKMWKYFFHSFFPLLLLSIQHDAAMMMQFMSNNYLTLAWKRNEKKVARRPGIIVVVAKFNSHADSHETLSELREVKMSYVPNIIIIIGFLWMKQRRHTLLICW